MDELTDVLSKKIVVLFEHVKQLKADNARLAEDNARLVVKVNELERALETDHERAERLGQECSIAKMAIDELVQNIDSLIGKEHQAK